VARQIIRFTALRMLQGVFLALAAAFLVFLFVYAIGDPLAIYQNPDLTQVQVDALRHQLGLDKSLPQQFLAFLARLMHGDWGVSMVHGRSALDVIIERFPATLELTTIASLLAIGVGLPMGIFAGKRENSVADSSVQLTSFVMFCVPTFWVGLLLILAFSVELRVLPSQGRGPTRDLLGAQWSFLTAGGWLHLLMPAFILSLTFMAMVMRLTRAGYIKQEGTEYVRFARAKGVPEKTIVRRHMLPNMAVPIITVCGLQFGHLLAYAIITEKVFSWPGMGKLIIDSIILLDRPMIVAYVMFVIFAIVFINFVVDVLCFLIDPRLRTGGRGL
jgi:peptide/nickel transport system permease protein